MFWITICNQHVPAVLLASQIPAIRRTIQRDYTLMAVLLKPRSLSTQTSIHIPLESTDNLWNVTVASAYSAGIIGAIATTAPETASKSCTRKPGLSCPKIYTNTSTVTRA
ncbi:hypothetical protein CERSUDRAFT_114170 [Gelatoporia subvermispora B]|uniref:Uncharacterized protein n=1 Tax=Ceriporiopsis subvermispora (strain B) TaxID=914234 RepID=M2QKJ6_CERS8|nr:hypothetical protein CERSUDRAFT_114170 [Gelatoporia subvermispora B]